MRILKRAPVSLKSESRLDAPADPLSSRDDEELASLSLSEYLTKNNLVLINLR